MNVLRIRRGDTYLMPLPDVTLKAGDRLRRARHAAEAEGDGGSPEGQALLRRAARRRGESAALGEPALAEIAVVQGSSLDRANLRFARFLDRYQLVVLALHRAGRDIWKRQEDIQDVILRQGDILLVQGPRDQIAALKQSTEFLVLDATVALPTTSKAPLALAILLAVVALPPPA